MFADNKALKILEDLNLYKSRANLDSAETLRRMQAIVVVEQAVIQTQDGINIDLILERELRTKIG